MDKTPGARGALNRLQAALLALYLKAEGAAVDPSRDVITQGKASTSKPMDYGSEYGVWLERVDALAEDIARVVQGGSRRRSVNAKELRRRIHLYEGQNTIYVAYHEGCSDALVRKVRSELRLSAEDGSRLERPLTAREVPMGQVPSAQDGILCKVDSQDSDV